ncbi:putative bifunctional diguanylate cyclase/phosphodiesterase [Aliidiomarina celeris]|uniref:putative bifunctional diguanylate cyclase/phosphodiesterase n=1 Tax=Aliidiomarina celeris TaxID=2249428 RepID=UPI000DE8F7E4|nr:EAL domain-containing protein [Aliidiomarina celeris]
MAGISFQTKLLLLLAGLVSTALAILVFAIYVATQASIDRNVERELGVSQRVFLQVLELREAQLQQAAAVLADDFGFREAVATADEGTILSALVNHGQRLQADLITLLSPQGEVVVTTHDIAQTERVLELASGQSGDDFGMIVAEGEIYQLVAVPVRAPHLIGVVVLGFAVDNQLAEQFRQLTNNHVSFVALLSNGDSFLVSSSEQIVGSNLLNEIEANPSGQAVLQSLGMRGIWIEFSGQQTLDGATEKNLQVLITASTLEAAAQFKQLQQQLTLVALFTLIAAILLALGLGAQVTKPVRMLADAAKRIALGRYDSRLEITSRDEIGQLALSFNSMQQAISEREGRISYQSYHDSMTDLPNRRYLTDEVQRRFAAQTPFVLVLMNLDNFSRLNNMFGQTVCDQLLVEVARRLRTLSQAEHWVARLHGDEFVLLSESVGLDFEQNLCAMLEQMQTRILLNNVSYSVDISAGFARYPEHGEEFDILLRRAQYARRAARREQLFLSGYTDGEEEPYLRALAVSAALKQALEEERFSLVFQPQIDLTEQRIAGVEALIRWIDPELGFVSPVEFIPLAEQSGVVNGITHWVLKKAIQQLVYWHEQGMKIAMSVNLSATDLNDSDLFAVVESQVNKAKLAPNYLTLEVTESAVMENPEQSIALLQRFKNAGYAIAIDDYGTGYSSLAQLRNLPADELKIDRAFVMNLSSDSTDQTIVESTIQMAHQLGLRVVAEGVETEEVWQALANYGCDLLQGYYIAKPMSESDFSRWFADFNLKEISPKA